MENILGYLLPVVMAAVLGVLGFGVVGMLRGRDPRRSNRLMQYRVILQGVAILIFVLLILFYRR
jgi:hypothetical protein